MTEFYKKAFYMGLGFASYGKEKMEALMKDYARYSGKSEEEGQKVFEEISQGAREARDEIEKNIKKETEHWLNELNISTMDRIKKLEARVQKLEKKLEEKK